MNEFEFKRRRPATVFALAAAVAVAAFVIGYAVADKRTGFAAVLWCPCTVSAGSPRDGERQGREP